MTIYLNDPTPNDGVDHTFVLTGDLFDAVVLGEGVDLNLNGFGVYGAGNDLNSVGILSNSPGAEVYGGTVTGFGAGVHLGGGNSAVGNMVVYDCLVRGIGVAGGNNSVYGNVVGSIGSPLYPHYGATSGIVAWDDDNYILGNNVYGVAGLFESVAYAVGGSAVVNGNLAQGVASTGWSFAFWSSAGDGDLVQLDDFRGYDFDIGIGIGGLGNHQVENSAIDAGRSIALASFDDLGGNDLSEQVRDNSATIIGTSGRDQISAGDGDNTIIGMGGGDTIYSGAGNDVFVFSPGGVLSVAVDFEQGADKISLAYYYADDLQYGAAATGAKAVMLWDASRHVLLHDPDGAGSQPAEYVAYMPYVEILTLSDFLL